MISRDGVLVSGVSVTERVVKEALALPAAMRAFVAEKLLESLDADANFELSPEWREEIAARCREIDEGKVELLDGDEVFKNARHRLE